MQPGFGCPLQRQWTVDTGQDVESFTCIFGGQARMHSHHIPPAWKGPEANRRRKISTRYGNTHPERGPDF